MIWNDDYLFLHYPKAAGKSLAVAFLKSWGTPVRAYISIGQLADLSAFIKPESTLWIHGAHQNLNEAAIILRGMDRKIENFRATFLAVRCPYDLVYSTYKFHRANAGSPSAPAEFSLAANCDFEEFVSRKSFVGYAPWMKYRGQDVANLRVIRFEKMAEDFRKYAKEFGFNNVRIPHLNATPGPNYLDVMTPAIEKTIFEQFRILFDKGYYTRLHLD
jgi:hypothetical protein